MGENNSDASPPTRGDRFTKALLWVGAVSVVSAVAAAIVVRATIGRTHEEPDPTSERIQKLIEEANQLLKSLDHPEKS